MPGQSNSDDGETMVKEGSVESSQAIELAPLITTARQIDPLGSERSSDDPDRIEPVENPGLPG